MARGEVALRDEAGLGVEQPGREVVADSRTASENAVRRSVEPISSAIEMSPFHTTVSVIGSMFALFNRPLPYR